MALPHMGFQEGPLRQAHPAVEQGREPLAGIAATHSRRSKLTERVPVLALVSATCDRDLR